MKVYKYESITRPSRHCREEVAVALEDGRLVDTFWSLGSESHTLTEAERATAVLVFDTDDYDQLPTYPRETARRTWEQYAPADRGIITSQHRLQADYYIRKGATPDLVTKIENARAELDEAQRKMRQAGSWVAGCQTRLDDLVLLSAARHE